MHTEHFNHAGSAFHSTGSGIPGRASGFLAVMALKRGNDVLVLWFEGGGTVSGGAALWGSGFFIEHQGFLFEKVPSDSSCIQS